MTADDVVYSLERSKEESTTDRICRDFFDYCEAASPTQVVIHMKSVAGPFISQLAVSETRSFRKRKLKAGEKTSVPTSSEQVLSHWKKL